MKIRNTSPMGDLLVPSIRSAVIAAGEVLDVTDTQWDQLRSQPDNFQRVPFAEFTAEELEAEAIARGIDPSSKKLAELLEQAIAPAVEQPEQLETTDEITTEGTN